MTRPARSGHTGLVTIPLLLTVAFCFAYVLIPAHKVDNSQTDSSDNIAAKSSLSTNTRPELSPTPASTGSSLKTVSTDNTGASASVGSANQAQVNNATSQGSDTTGKSLQSAVANNRPKVNISQSIEQLNEEINQAGNTLKHLLP